MSKAIIVLSLLMLVWGCGPGATATPEPLPKPTATEKPTAILMPTEKPIAMVTPTEKERPTLTATPTEAPTLIPSPAEEEERYAEARRQMTEYQISARDVTDEEVLQVMEKVPRHKFVPPEYRDRAYTDYPLPIGYGQTISQPYIVALMTKLLNLERGERVLEIGTGSGYQAAILSELTDEVYTVEIIEELEKQAEGRLKDLGYTNVKVKHADGYYGWEEYAPYDAIIVTCAPDHIPQPLINQLKDGGRLVIPVGPPGAYQTLWQITRQGDQLISKNILGVRFVPLTGEH